MASNEIKKIHSVEEFTAYYKIPSAGHPLININRIIGMNYDLPIEQTAQFNLYAIVFKQGVKGTNLYGWRKYDFSKGLMSFFAPGQIIHWDQTIDLSESSGWLLVFHPDFIRKYPMADKIIKYKFFSYETNEALFMSDVEKVLIETLLESIYRECNNNMDDQSQDIIVSQIDLVLNYAERFYKRQFRTRYSVESDIISRFQKVLQDHLESGKKELIYANEIASELNMSTHYLADLLRNLTGMNTQQHIHAFIIEKAKSLLLATNLSVNEIAYQLGFEYPTYFNRLFKRKTGTTPAEFRKMP